MWGMSHLLASIAQDQDWPFVVLAGGIGMIASLAALSLLVRAAASHDRRRLLWVAATAALAGSAVPATYLMATLPMSGAPWLALLSVAAAMLLVGGAFMLGLVGRRQQQAVPQAAPAETESLRAALSEIAEEKRRLETKTADLTSALEIADAGDRAKSQFLATMSHELRTQLNAIIGFAEFLGTDLCGSLTPKQRGYVGDIHRAGGHLLQLVGDVHDLARIDARQLALEDDVVDLGDSIAAAITMITPRAAEVGIALHSVVAAGLPQVRADAKRFRQVLLNLLANAVKFTPRGGAVTVSAERRGAAVAVIVADTGIGMTAEQGAGDGRFGRPSDGGGLGLPLVKRLVELHDGTLVIDSAPGRGTTVTVLLPAERIVDRSKAA
jgi:signal transduction histidine kinase